MAHLETWAVSFGIGQIWVCTETGSRAVPFYLRCGYQRVEEMTARNRGPITILTT